MLIGDPWFLFFVLFCLASRVEWEQWALSISFVRHVACDVWLSMLTFLRLLFLFSASFCFCVSWTTTGVSTYWAEIGTVFNVKTTTTTRRACAFYHSPSSRRGHLVLVCNIIKQFVRTAHIKHKHLLALSTENGGPPSPPRPEPLYIYIYIYIL